MFDEPEEDDCRLLELLLGAEFAGDPFFIRSLVRILQGILSDSSMCSFTLLLLSASLRRSCNCSTEEVGGLMCTESLVVSVNKRFVYDVVRDSRTLS